MAEQAVKSTMRLFSGRLLNLLDPRPEQFTIQDIAHGLSMECRWGGQCNPFFSVAQHSVLVAHVLPPEFKLWGLLHDASEGLGYRDLPAPLKRQPAMEAYRAAEARAMGAVGSKFSLHPYIEPAEVKRADLQVRMFERDLLWPMDSNWSHAEALPEFPQQLEGIQPWDQPTAERAFLEYFWEVTGQTVVASLRMPCGHSSAWHEPGPEEMGMCMLCGTCPVFVHKPKE